MLVLNVLQITKILQNIEENNNEFAGPYIAIIWYAQEHFF